MITILNKNNLKIMQLSDNLDSEIEERLSGQWIINPDLSAVNGVDKKYWKLVNDSVLEMDQSEKDAIDAQDFFNEKIVRYEAIDAKTANLISQGFRFPEDGYVFSLSMESQANIHGIFTARNLNGIVYPIHWLSLDEQGSIDLQNADDVEAFFLTAIGTIRAHKDSGSVLKDQVTVAQNMEELLTIMDNR